MLHKIYQKYKTIILGAGAFLIIAIAYFGLKDSGEQHLENEIEQSEPETVYGINSEKYTIYEDEIKKDELLASILLKNGINYTKINNLVEKSKDIFDIRKIRPKHKYTLLTTNDSLEKLHYFIYEINNIDYVEYSFKDSITVTRKQKEVVTKTQEASGTINSSLYLTMSQNKLPIELAMKLADMYAWTIDFYRIQKGDQFKIIYDQQFVEGKSVGISHIHAAVFNHKNEDYYGIYFEQSGVGDYFDEKNNSMRKFFLKAPLNFSRISSRFTKKRFHPVQKRWKAHLGTDYAAAKGTPIWSTANGTVVAAQYKRFNGNYVKVRHNGTYTTQYLHMSKIAKGIRKGKRVRQGQIIGYVGSTGLATGPHVCYRFWKNGKQVDPYSLKLPPSNPVNKKNLASYKKVKSDYIIKLNEIEYSE